MRDAPIKSAIDILLVDDKPENLLTLEAVLTCPEYNLIKANSGMEALKYLLSHDCAIILMDVQMPVMDGFETAEIVKQSERSSNIPIIFVTAINTDQRFVNKGYKTGAVDYLFKPFDADILRSKVSVFADLYRARQKIEEQAERLREIERLDRERALAQLELKSLRREQIVQEKYRDLVNGISHGIIWAADPLTLNFSFVSPSAEKLLGFPVDSWTEEVDFFKNRLHPDDKELFFETARNAFEYKKDFSLEHRLISADHTVSWFYTEMRMSTKNELGTGELRGLSIDLTKTKRAEEALKFSEERARFMAEASLALSQSLDFQTTLKEIGRLTVPRLADFYSIDLLDENGELQSLSLAHTNANKEKLAISLRSRFAILSSENFGGARVVKTGKSELYPQITEQHLREHFNDDHHFEEMQKIGIYSLMVVPLLTRGKILGTMSFVQSQNTKQYSARDLELAEDLARRTALAIDNSQLYQAAQKAIRTRDEFLSIASHELKTPLTPLKLQIQMMLRTLTKTPPLNIQGEKVLKMISSSDRQLERLSRLIEDLLDISRINIGKLGLNPEAFNLGDLIEEILERFSDQLIAAKCEISFDKPRESIGNWDRFRIEQVVVNLLTNAIKYGPGKPIHISLRKEHTKIILSVKDQGIGIAKKDHARVFERFERAVSAGHFGGLGLGLYIVSEIINAHEGRIWLDSNLGEGSCFTLELPVEISPAVNKSSHLRPEAFAP